MRFTPFAVLAAASFSACTVSSVPTGPLQYDSSVVERGDAQSARVNLNIGAGELKVSSGTEKLMRAYFTYNVPQFKPEVRSSVNGGVAEISISQPSSHAHFGNAKYEWDVRLSRDIPLEVDVHTGAGEAQLDLGSLDLRRVSVEMGVGQLQLDLRGIPKHDYSVTVQGGVGEAVLRLPNSAGIEATASGGIGNIEVHGLTKEGGRWVNDAFHNPGVKVHVEVSGGVGQIRLSAE